MYEMAALDPLTGVYTRRFFEQRMLRELRTAFRSQQPLALLMLDLDHLKQINDVAGHLVGDQALRIFGQVLRQTTRSNDIVGRYGDRIAALGGVDMDKLARLDEASLREYIRSIVDKCAPGGRFALGSGNSIANYIPLANYAILLDESRQWQIS